MKYIMIHPKTGAEKEVALSNIRQLVKLGWKRKTDPTSEVIDYQKKTETLEFIQQKKVESGCSGSCRPGEVQKIEPVKVVAPVVVPEPVINDVPGVDEPVADKVLPEVEPERKPAKPVVKKTGGRFKKGGKK